MHVFEEMKHYVRFSASDADLLASLWPSVRPQVRVVSAQFYDRILEFEDARRVFEDEAQVRRLQRTLEVWMEELLCGPHDLAYYDRRRRIGEKHVAVHLPHRYMITAMEVLQEGLCRIAIESHDPTTAEAMCGAIRRITMLDLAIMTGTFLGVQLDRDVQEAASVLVAHLPAPALLLDHDLRVVSATDAARAVLGDELLGRHFSETLRAEVLLASEIPAAVDAARDQGQSTELPRVEAVLDGVLRTWRMRVVPIQHPRLAVMLLAEEITDALAEEARQRKMETLAQLGSMSAAVAHELRNPLAGISGAIQIMATSMTEADPRRAVMGKVKDQIGRLDRMVRDLLTFAANQTPSVGRVDLAATARAAIELLPPVPHVRITIEGAGHAVADGDLVQRIVLNLVQNAVSALDGTPGRITVRAVDGCLEVSDDGPGIDARTSERIFEPFFTTKTTGTGLGLAICRNAAEAMGGQVSLTKHLGGATFRLVLPTS